MNLIRCILLCSAVLNLFTFITGLFMGIFRQDLIALSISLTIVGLLGMSLFAVCWFLKPKKPEKYVKKFKQQKLCQEEKINPDNTEEVMRSIRGIPFLIQAIQYSMETTYYRDLMSELGEGVVRTSVIHTAPACTSVLDSDHEEDEPVPSFTPRHSAEEQWLPIGENWRNQQLRLSLKNASSNLLVFPLCEASPQRESFDREVTESEFARIDSIRRPHGLRKAHAHLYYNANFRSVSLDDPEYSVQLSDSRPKYIPYVSFSNVESTRPKAAHNAFQVRCIGMSASFIEKFNSSFRGSLDK